MRAIVAKRRDTVSRVVDEIVQVGEPELVQGIHRREIGWNYSTSQDVMAKGTSPETHKSDVIRVRRGGINNDKS